jgi:phosphoserine phosphatase
MSVAVLIADPADRPLSPARAADLARRLGGGLRWLSPGEAAEIAEVAVLPPGLWEDCQAEGLDLALVPSEGRRKRLLLADMDSTMIGQECIDELADVAGVGAEVAAITSRAMNGELDFEGALVARVSLLRGLPLAAVDRVLAERITLAPGGRALVATMTAAGARAALVSGGFTAFTAPIAAALGFHEHRANTLLSRDGVLTGEVARPILGRAAKVEALDRIAAAMGIGAQDVLAVGDGANDLGMIARAGLGVALHAKPVVQAQAPIRINHGDLTALLFLQGYRRAEFVTP